MSEAQTADVALAIPDAVCNKALAAGAESWLADLPALIAELESEWSIEVGAPFVDATEAYVAAATMADRSPVVLKLLVPRAFAAAEHEIAVLRLAAGHGCVSLLASDVARGALLLERLGPSLSDLGLPFGRRLEVLAATAARVWRRAPGSGLPSGAAKGRWLIEHVATVWNELDRPCSERAIQHARWCAARRIAAHDDERAVLVHGDVHQWNTLRTLDGEEYKLVDPDGLLAEPEYDLGILMREDPVELMAGDPFERAAWLANRTGLDASAIWEWGVVERVSTGLLGLRIGLQPVADQMLAAADAIAAAWSP
jgi:streptomycin 6-kinase